MLTDTSQFTGVRARYPATESPLQDSQSLRSGPVSRMAGVIVRKRDDGDSRVPRPLSETQAVSDLCPRIIATDAKLVALRKRQAVVPRCRSFRLGIHGCGQGRGKVLQELHVAL